MIYLDYSASTKAEDLVIEEFIKLNQENFSNPNSNHELGLSASNLIKTTTAKIRDQLKLKAYEVIYTSGATEANNLGIIGYCEANKHIGKHIITSPYEHSSVTSCLNYLAKQGYDIDVLDTNSKGLVDVEELSEIVRDDTVLITIAAVNSELGIVQNVEAISNIARAEHVAFHCDMTQAIGKTKMDPNLADLISFSGHKIYGLKGVGALLRKESINLEPVVKGGKSNSIFRGGTPPMPLIVSLGTALTLALSDFDEKLALIKENATYLISHLSTIKCFHLNYKYGLNQIINMSFTDILANDLRNALSKKHIYISTQTACNSEASNSLTVKRLTGSDLLAKTSIRVSISHKTTKEELNEFVQAVKEILHENN